MNIKKNLVVSIMSIALIGPVVNTVNINNYSNNVPSVVAYASTTLSSLSKKQIISLVKKGLHATVLNVPNISKQGNLVKVSYNTGANAGAKVTLTQMGNKVHIHAQPMQSKGTASPGGQTMKPTNKLSVANISRADATILLPGAQNNTSTKSTKSTTKPSNTNNDTSNKSDTGNSNNTNTTPNSNESDHKQLVKQRQNNAIKKGSIAGIGTAVVLFLLYGLKRLIGRNKR